MKKSNLTGLMFAGLSAAALVGCSEDISLADQMSEDYAKAFVERYGLPGEGNMFNMARRGKVTVKSSKPVSVEIIAQENGKYYSFGFYQGISGTQALDFDIPSYIQDIVLYVDGQYYPTKVGATYDLDHPLRSRADEALVWSDARLKDVKTTTLPYTANTNGDGRVNADFSSLTGYDSNGKSGTSSGIIATGAELKQYVSDNASDYDKFENTDGGVSWNYPEFYMAILNVNKPNPAHKYEIGVYYGNKGKMIEADAVTFIPLYRTDEVQDNKSVISEYIGQRPADSQFEAAGMEFVIEFNGNDFKTKREPNVPEPDKGKFEYTKTQYFYGSNETVGINFTKNNKASYGDNSLEAKLERHAAAQAKADYPKLADLATNGASDYGGLPVLDATDQWAFYSKYDAYIYAWLSDAAHADYRKDVVEYEEFRQLLGTLPRFLPEHAVPIVKKEGDQRYRVSYYTAYSSSEKNVASKYSGAAGESLCKYQDDKVYSCSGVSVAVPGYNTNGAHEFTVYMKDIDDGTVVSTSNGAKVKAIGRYIQTGEVWASDGYGVTMIDFDGDGVYNDFVYRHAVPGGSNDKPTFEPYTWYLACEDLGSTGDCDFNDAVYAIQYITGNSLTTQNINVKPLAAGGIYPTYLMWSDGIKDYMVGKELHSWLGNDTRDEKDCLPFINTREETFPNKVGATATFHYDLLQHETRFSIDSYENLRWGTGTIAGFWVLVDKDNVLADLANKNVTFMECDAAAIQAQYPGSLWKVNNMPIGNSLIPQMMLLSQEWEWPQETKNITTAYPEWQTWMNSDNGKDIKWYGFQLEGVDRTKVVKRWK